MNSDFRFSLWTNGEPSLGSLRTPGAFFYVDMGLEELRSSGQLYVG
jgi:hypothetical protein